MSVTQYTTVHRIIMYRHIKHVTVFSVVVVAGSVVVEVVVCNTVYSCTLY